MTFEDSGTLFDVPVTGLGSYTSVARADGSIYGSGQGMSMTEDGESATWSGTGLGHFGPGGSVSYRGMLFFRTNSTKLSRLNNTCAVFEYEVDGKGNTVSQLWEWKIEQHPFQASPLDLSKVIQRTRLTRHEACELR